MKAVFKYLLFIVLSIFLNGQISASSVFSSIEKKGTRVYELFKEGDDTSKLVRTNSDNLKKLSNFITETGIEKSKLVNSFKNAKNPQKWLDMKIPQKELDALYDGFKNSPPSKFDAWTPEHKAQRWANHKAGNPDTDFKSWSNRYDGNIGKAKFANNGVDDYFKKLDWDCSLPPCRERLIPDITTVVDGKVVKGGRRLDIADMKLKKGKEFKEYSSGKVYNSLDIRREVAMDKQLLLNKQLNEIEWVFKGCVPSAPLEKALREANILIKKIP